ncbi:MAG: hypothetical protein M1820_001650 [Bogoriella megaspora]|nr:MAG: hypothetical protein M1820_001650 [Bogoriella megaspora]
MKNATNNPSQQPLLGRRNTDNDNTPGYESISGSESSIDDEEARSNTTPLDRSVENDVLPETAVLGRNLGWSSAYILIISRVVGSGIFATPGAIVRDVGSVGITLSLWIVGALISWFALAITLEYGCDKVYLEFTYRRPRFLATVLIAVQSVLLGFTASNCIVFADYVLFALDREPSKAEVKVVAAALLTSIILVHSCFRKTGIFIQNIFGWIKIALVIFMIFASLFAVIFRPRNESTTELATVNGGNIWEGSVWNLGLISTALFKVFYSYAGLHNVNNVMNEVKNPVKTLRSASSIALLTACVLYFLVNVAYFLVVPIDEIKESGELIAALFFQRTFGAHVGKIILPIAVAISAAGNVMVVTFSHARMIQEIARQDFLPFSRIIASTKPFNAPMGALVTHYIPSLLVILIPTGNVYSFILNVEGYPANLFALASSFGIIWLRFKRPDLHRPYKAFLPAVWFRIAFSIALLIAPFVPSKELNWRQHLSQVSYAFVGISILEEAPEILDDGTTITKLVQVPRGSKPVSTAED